MKKNWWLILFLLVIPAFFSQTVNASGKKIREPRAAIVLASFGTTVPEAVSAITNIRNQVKQAFPETPVKITFTSNIIRSVWKKRQAEPEKWRKLGIPEEILYVKNIISTVGDLLEDGYRDIVVQPTHMYFMEQSYDLTQYIEGLRSIRTIKRKWMPFRNLVMGRPALGMPGDRYPYEKDMEEVLHTLSKDFARAKQENAVLIYMGHGNEHWSVGIYGEAVKMMKHMYPGIECFVGVVEGYPGIDDVKTFLSTQKPGNVLLKPFMIVAGDHAMNDMAGPDEDSWKNVISQMGFHVIPVMKGLGSNDAFARIFVDHIRDAARDGGIELK